MLSLCVRTRHGWCINVWWFTEKFIKNVTYNFIVGRSIPHTYLFGLFPGCAYADHTFTAEQAVLAAYWRGCSIAESDISPGAMAAVGLSWEECHRRCPPNIYPACHNSNNSVTVSVL